MRCRQCETEIDDHALICFRCGRATSDPVHQPHPLEEDGPRRGVPIVLTVLFIAAAGFFGYQASRGVEVPPAVWAMLAAAGVLLAIRLRLRT